MHCICWTVDVCIPSDLPFPANFSLMTTVKAVKGSQVFLLSMYDTQVCTGHAASGRWNCTVVCCITMKHSLSLKKLPGIELHYYFSEYWQPVPQNVNYLGGFIWLLYYSDMKTTSAFSHYNFITLTIFPASIRAHNSLVWRLPAHLCSCMRTTRANQLRSFIPSLERSTWLMASG